MKRILMLWFMIGLAAKSFAGHSDTALIKLHLKNLTKTEGYRNYQDLKTLNEAAQYIFEHFSKYSDSVVFQEYEVLGNTYKNVICSFGTGHKERIIVGAHYDVCENQEGADDNASGVVGVLELARLLKDEKLNYRIDLVAYTLEEPPFFYTEHMGSYIHARSLVKNNIPVYGMISLEMIGYFSDEKSSQGFPAGFLKLFYGNKGDFITLVKKFNSGKFARKFSKIYAKNATIKTKQFKGPRWIPGLDYSDHLNFWGYGISALMITDTSFYRNHNYHKKTDTMETLDIPRMAKVIDGVFIALKKMK